VFLCCARFARWHRNRSLRSRGLLCLVLASGAARPAADVVGESELPADTSRERRAAYGGSARSAHPHPARRIDEEQLPRKEK
jgi:hypothetical protein